MSDTDFDAVLRELKTSSKISLAMVVLGVACVLGSLYYSATRLTPLETKIAQLNGAIDTLNKAVDEKQQRLNGVERKLTLTSDELNTSFAALDALQEGTRYLMNRQYSDAIKRFAVFAEAQPSSSAALNFLGYAELRYAIYCGTTHDGNDPQYAQCAAGSERFFESAERHLSSAVEMKDGYTWPIYNLSLLYLIKGEKGKAMSSLSAMLGHAPQMVEWVCGDGQFRKMKADPDLAQPFSALVDQVARTQGVSPCWVTSPFK